MFGFGFSNNFIRGNTEGMLLDPFIVAHEEATGVTMAETQRSAVTTLKSMLQGDGTTNGSNLWADLVANDARMWIFCPSDDTTISYEGCNVDLITASTKGTFNNFVSGDLSVNGLTGGSTKYFASDKAPDDYSPFNVGIFINISDFQDTGVETGGGGTSTANATILNVRTTSIDARISSNTTTVHTVTNSLGSSFFVGMQRDSNSTIDVIKDGSIVLAGASNVYTGIASQVQYFHARNSGGSPLAHSTSQMNIYLQGTPALTANEVNDLNECITTFNTNVITGGR